MRNIWRLFVGDLKRLGGNTITVLAILGLVALPSLFSWFNMLACWNVFENTGHLTVAVANTDEGYESDLVAIKVNIGDQVVSALRANDQLNWVFTTEADAIEGTREGRYYAAVVIPPGFSRDMMTFYRNDAESASLTYYSNEKKSAIAPKVTDQGADQVSNQVNRVFTETLSEISLGLASALHGMAVDADADGNIARLANHLNQLGTQLGRTADALRMYATIIETSEALVSDSATLLVHTQESAEEVAQSAKEAISAAETTADAMEQAAQGLADAVQACTSAFAGVPEAIDGAFDSADAVAASSATALRDTSANAGIRATELHEAAAALREVEPLLPEEDALSVENAAKEVDAIAVQHEQIRDSLNSAADKIDAEDRGQKDTRAQVEALLAQSQQSLADARAEFDNQLKPTLDELAATLEHASGTLRNTGAKLKDVGGQMEGTASSIEGKLDESRTQLRGSAESLDSSSAEVTGLATEIETALAAGDGGALQKILGSDPEALAAVLSAPVKLDREAIYPVQNFGSAMSPLYTSLALWIGCLLTMVAFRPNPSRRTQKELDSPTPRQLFVGRFGVIALVSLMQSSMLALGNLLFLNVQADNPLLYLVCFWVSGLVFAFIIYTLVSTFLNLGKAISVLLLILQVSGGGGSFPLQLLPDFFQTVSPYLPVTHVVNAMRAAMFGVYANDFFIEMGILVLFTIPLIFLGLVLRAPILKITTAFLEKTEASKLM